MKTDKQILNDKRKKLKRLVKASEDTRKFTKCDVDWAIDLYNETKPADYPQRTHNVKCPRCTMANIRADLFTFIRRYDGEIKIHE